MKAIIYLRVSTAGQAAEGVSMEAQEAKARAWAVLNGAESVSVFSDAGVSGSRADNRPGLQAALQSVGGGDALIVYSLSRLARCTRDAISIAERLDKCGADLVSLSERIDTTSAAGKMVFRLLAVLNEFERDLIGERTRLALAYIRSQGRKTGGDVPYGFRLDGGRLIPDEHEQRAIRLIQDLHSEGATLREIAARLESEGYRTKTGRLLWHPSAVAAILSRKDVQPVGISA